jgi:hypothetical protein
VLQRLIEIVRPATWWEAERPRKATRTATVIWAVLLTLLALTLVLSQSSDAR